MSREMLCVLVFEDVVHCAAPSAERTLCGREVQEAERSARLRFGDDGGETVDVARKAESLKPLCFICRMVVDIAQRRDRGALEILRRYVLCGVRMGDGSHLRWIPAYLQTLDYFIGVRGGSASRSSAPARRPLRADAETRRAASPFYFPDGTALRGQYRQELAEDALDLGRAVGEYVVALSGVDPHRGDQDLFYRLVQALCEIVPVAACLRDDLDVALRVVTTHFGDSCPGRPLLGGDVDKTWRRWLRALLLSRFGSHRRAENMLALCRRDFDAAKRLPEYLATSLDLGEILFEQGRFEELQRLAAEAVFHYRSLDSVEARAMLLMWRDAVLHEDLTIEIHRKVRTEIGQWMREDLLCREAEPTYEGPRFKEAMEDAASHGKRAQRKRQAHERRQDRSRRVFALTEKAPSIAQAGQPA